MPVHVAFTPDEAAPAAVGIVVDVLRATSTIAQALATGYKRVLCCAELQAVRIEGFDVGASPREFLEPRAETLILSTTNGTRAILETARRCDNVFLGSLLNVAAVAEAARGDDVVVVCAGFQGGFALDDVYCAGRIVQLLEGEQTHAATAAGLLASAVAAALSPAGTSAQKPWLWQCTQIHNAEAQYRCYVRLLRQDIEASHDPARELPRIDRRVRAVGGPLEAGCHVLMH